MTITMNLDPELVLHESVQTILGNLPCSVALPAGCGKTEVIAGVAKAVAGRGGSTLILTHTNTGVDAIRRRLKRFGVATSSVNVTTIDSWSLRLIRSHPQLADINVPEAPDWGRAGAYHQAAARAVGTPPIERMLKASYQLILVDEYQDCMIDQHELVHALSEVIDTAVLGDPLQCLLDFGQQTPVQWPRDVLPVFPEVAVAQHPWRWATTNPELGEWLLRIRAPLENGEPIDLDTAPIRWLWSGDHQGITRACRDADQRTVAALGHFRQDCIGRAKLLGGSYFLLEALDEQRIMKFCTVVDTGESGRITAATVEFAAGCATHVSKHVDRKVRDRLHRGGTWRPRTPELKSAAESLDRLAAHPSPANVRDALQQLVSMDTETAVYGQEAFTDVCKALGFAHDQGLTTAQALSRIRDQRRRSGRHIRKRVIGRPLLVKGLEYEHAILLDADRYKTNHLYVALTRGSRALTIASGTRKLNLQEPGLYRTKHT
ncbi:UvrD-helicase domain-containing protein [Glycomyces buryatensis]|nr:UvrD-helicase domain-containing protein [Glycomyces buryatensis]